MSEKITSESTIEGQHLDLLRLCQPRDIVEFGFIPEFVGWCRVLGKGAACVCVCVSVHTWSNKILCERHFTIRRRSYLPQFFLIVAIIAAGRLPVQVPVGPLSHAQLVQVLTEPQNAIVKQAQKQVSGTRRILSLLRVCTAIPSSFSLSSRAAFVCFFHSDLLLSI